MRSLMRMRTPRDIAAGVLATVRRAEPELDGPTMDDLYDDDCVDYPETLLPFAGHPGWNGLDEDRRSRVRASSRRAATTGTPNIWMRSCR